MFLVLENLQWHTSSWTLKLAHKDRGLKIHQYNIGFTFKRTSVNGKNVTVSKMSLRAYSWINLVNF